MRKEGIYTLFETLSDVSLRNEIKILVDILVDKLV